MLANGYQFNLVLKVMITILKQLARCGVVEFVMINLIVLEIIIWENGLSNEVFKPFKKSQLCFVCLKKTQQT